MPLLEKVKRLSRHACHGDQITQTIASKFFLAFKLMIWKKYGNVLRHKVKQLHKLDNPRDVIKTYKKNVLWRNTALPLPPQKSFLVKLSM